MSTKRISGKDLSKAVTSDDVLGKEVIDLDGRFIGVVEKIFVDPETLELIGIGIDKGFLKKGLEIGRDYLERVTPHALFLSISLALEIKGMQVFDIRGALVGTVSTVNLVGERNIISTLDIKPSSGFFGKSLSISAREIASIGRGVFLNIGRTDIKG